MSLFAMGEGGKISFRPSRERARREIISHKPRNASPSKFLATVNNGQGGEI